MDALSSTQSLATLSFYFIDEPTQLRIKLPLRSDRSYPAFIGALRQASAPIARQLLDPPQLWNDPETKSTTSPRQFCSSDGFWYARTVRYAPSIPRTNQPVEIRNKWFIISKKIYPDIRQRMIDNDIIRVEVKHAKQHERDIAREAQGFSLPRPGPSTTQLNTRPPQGQQNVLPLIPRLTTLNRPEGAPGVIYTTQGHWNGYLQPTEAKEEQRPQERQSPFLAATQNPPLVDVSRDAFARNFGSNETAPRYPYNPNMLQRGLQLRAVNPRPSTGLKAADLMRRPRPLPMTPIGPRRRKQREWVPVPIQTPPVPALRLTSQSTWAETYEYFTEQFGLGRSVSAPPFGCQERRLAVEVRGGRTASPPPPPSPEARGAVVRVCLPPVRAWREREAELRGVLGVRFGRAGVVVPGEIWAVGRGPV